MTLIEAKEYTNWLARWVVIGLLLSWGITVLPFGRDDTDPADGRSGIRPRTDARTGCQYIETSQGGITPRLDVSGRQIGCSR